MKGTLYLIPSTLGESASLDTLAATNFHIIENISHFIVEDIRTARRFLKKVKPDIVIDNLSFQILNEHSAEGDIPSLLQPLLDGESTGLLSEAGLPCVADPGARLVNLAHEAGIRVVPLPGPSSVFMALMASGFNGQNFTFHGYLPVEKRERSHRIRELEADAYHKDQTQVFIEAPYRNNQLLEALIGACLPETKICVAVDLSLADEWIRTDTVKHWRKNKPDLHKRPAVFLLYH